MPKRGPAADSAHIGMICLLQELTYNKLPKLHKHLQATGCEMSIIATDWFLCLFATTLPSEVSVESLFAFLEAECLRD